MSPPRLAAVMLALGAVLLGACAECDAAACPNGCCSNGVCYEGTNIKGGQACTSLLGTGGGAGGSSCVAAGQKCSFEKCCAVGGTAYECRYDTCQPAACVELFDPCNASLKCCAYYTTSTSGSQCVAEHCEMCDRKGKECTPSIAHCCAGTSCLLKSGFTSVYECR